MAGPPVHALLWGSGPQAGAPERFDSIESSYRPPVPCSSFPRYTLWRNPGGIRAPLLPWPLAVLLDHGRGSIGACPNPASFRGTLDPESKTTALHLFPSRRRREEG